MGHRDDRVDTLSCLEAAAAIMRINRSGGYPDDKTQLFCTDDEGHRVESKWFALQCQFLMENVQCRLAQQSPAGEAGRTGEIGTPAACKLQAAGVPAVAAASSIISVTA